MSSTSMYRMASAAEPPEPRSNTVLKLLSLRHQDRRLILMYTHPFVSQKRNAP
jgi:hypothetical protein